MQYVVTKANYRACIIFIVVFIVDVICFYRSCVKTLHLFQQSLPFPLPQISSGWSSLQLLHLSLHLWEANKPMNRKA